MPLSYNVPSNASTFYTTSIEGILLTFKFNWQTRDSAWYIDITTQDDEYLAKGAKLMTNMPLITQNLDKAPSGNLLVVNSTSISKDNPGRNNIGPDKEFRLLYFTSEELTDVS